MGRLAFAGDRLRTLLLIVGIFVATCILWQGAVRWFAVSPVVVPTPLNVLGALWYGFTGQGGFLPNLGVTLVETLAGFALGVTAGTLLGVGIAEFPLLRRVLYPYIVAFQTVPKVAIAPLFVIWFGFGLSSKVAIAAAISFFPIVVNVIAGLTTAEAAALEMLIVFGGSRWQRFVLAKLPGSLPFFFAGLDVAIVLSITGAIVAEFVGSQQGLGYLIMQYNFTLDTAGIFAVLVVLSLMGIVLHLLVQQAHRRIVFWQRETTRIGLT